LEAIPGVIATEAAFEKYQIDPARHFEVLAASAEKGGVETQ
jgi:hypothetical protein